MLDAWKNASFEYGRLDCFLFVCAVLLDRTGVDYAARWRGKYHSEFGARRQIARYGSFKDAMIEAFGEIHPIAQVQPGDVVLLAPPLVDGDSIGAGVGIYDGESLAYLTDNGLARAPVLAGKGCFHV